MQSLSKMRHSVSFRRIAMQVMSGIALPLFAVVILFDWYTVKNQQQAVRSAYRGTLSNYRGLLEDTLKVTENYITATGANDMDFQSILYARSKTEAYVASQAISRRCKSLLEAHELLGGFFTYTPAFDYYHPTYLDSYPRQDLDALRAALTAASVSGINTAKWEPLPLSDRTVFLYTFVSRGTVIAAMIDPSRQSYPGLEPDSRILYTLPNGSPIAPSAAPDGFAVSPAERSGHTFRDANGRRYDWIGLPLLSLDGYILYVTPSVTFLQQLSVTQRVLLAITLGLLASIPLCWLMLRRLLLQPLDSLTETMQAIQLGNTEIRVPQDSNVYEVTEIARTVNTMLDTIRRQKIDSYEQQLEVQSAQLQYLQLQIRPHFFLNCLNLIYSLSEEQKYGDLQTLIIDLSTYLRSIFKDSSKLVPLREEIASVDSYIRIQRAGNPVPPRLWLMIDADAPQAEIPPLSILTFVENAVKHARPPADLPLAIRIQCSLLHSPAGDYLNASVCDNGGGFTQEQLREFNHPHDDLYTDRHVGIANIRHRFRLLYGDRAALFFRNLTDGACVELVLPLNQKKTGDDLP